MSPSTSSGLRKFAAVVLLIAGGCNLRPTEWEARGLNREDLEAGPTYHSMKGAILNDVRIWRQLDQKLDEGTLECAGIIREQAVPKCAKDQEELVHFPLKEDLPDQPYRVDEEAYYCPLESVYFYHYAGGPRKRNIWLGPYKVNRPARKLDDDK